ncbi:MAG: hypothetical protein ACE5I7_05575 [Candidatus Binatia bacterium]
MRCRSQSSILLLVGIASLVALPATPPLHATTISVINLDGVGEGFNDQTPRGPEGGNPGTTLGDLRLNAFQEAADRWAAIVASSVVVKVEGSFNPLTPCGPGGAVLGFAGPNSVFRDFLNAPVANTWFVQATANSIAGMDLSGGGSDMSATFNSSIDDGCLPGLAGWYYGFDGNPPAGELDFLPVLAHEIAHGLGFLTLVSLGSGAKFHGFNDAFMLNLENHTTGKFYPAMTDAERVAASTNTGNLHFVGANVRAASDLLSVGKTGDHVHMFAPNPSQPGSSVSHFDTSLTPNELMEPSFTQTRMQTLTEAAFADIGWTLLGQGPTATPTVTPTPTPIPEPPACPATPLAGCRTPLKSRFLLKDKTVANAADPDKRDRLVWKWLRGPATTFAELGNPVANLSSYSLCVYDESAGTPTLVLSAGAPAGGTCRNGKPCWQRLGTAANPTGYRYRNADLTPDGLLKIVLRKGDTPGGQARVVVIGKGANLPLPLPVGTTYFNQDTTAIVQFIKSDGGICWEARYASPARKNQSSVFRDTCGVAFNPPC